MTVELLHVMTPSETAKKQGWVSKFFSRVHERQQNAIKRGNQL